MNHAVILYISIYTVNIRSLSISCVSWDPLHITSVYISCGTALALYIGSAPLVEIYGYRVIYYHQVSSLLFILSFFLPISFCRFYVFFFAIFIPQFEPVRASNSSKSWQHTYRAMISLKTPFYTESIHRNIFSSYKFYVFL